MARRPRSWSYVAPALEPLLAAPAGPRSRPRRRRTQASSGARGYNADHRALRLAWKPAVDAGMVDCHADICLMPQRRIAPGSKWCLGHTPDRSGWTGPEHLKCSSSDGARRGNAMRGEKARQRQPRIW